MFTKSLIQQRCEFIELKSQFAKDLSCILEEYEVPNAVMGMNNGRAIELSSGYFVPVVECDSLEDAIRNLTTFSQAIRIIESKKFIVGDVYEGLSMCDDKEHIFSIEYLEDVC